MKPQIVILRIKDDEIQYISYLINPNATKLAELKHMVEHRHDYMFDERLSDAEIIKAEEFCDNIWDNIDNFINENFITLDIDDVYDIEY